MAWALGPVSRWHCGGKCPGEGLQGDVGRAPTLLSFQLELNLLLLPGCKGASLSFRAAPGPCGHYHCTYLAGAGGA